jgi:hypothetical protein
LYILRVETNYDDEMLAMRAQSLLLLPKITELIIKMQKVWSLNLKMEKNVFVSSFITPNDFQIFL